MLFWSDSIHQLQLYAPHRETGPEPGCQVQENLSEGFIQAAQNQDWCYLTAGPDDFMWADVLARHSSRSKLPSGLPASSHTGISVSLAVPKTAVQGAGGQTEPIPGWQLSVTVRLPSQGTFRTQRSAAAAEKGQEHQMPLRLLPAVTAATGKSCVCFHLLLWGDELCCPCPTTLSSWVYL